MRTPICSICLESGILCPKCERNVSYGKITKEGIEFIKTIYHMSKNIKSLDKISIEKVLVSDSLIVLQCPKTDVANAVGKSGRVVNGLKAHFGKQIKVIGNEDYRSMLLGLFFPAKLSGTDKLYSNNGESLRIRIEKNQLRNLPSKRDDLLFAAKEITGMNVELVVS